MKRTDIIEILKKDFATSNVDEINEALKVNPDLKFRITGKSLGHFGFTGKIKSLTDEGLKVFNANKVSLVRFSEIETFDKAKAKIERPQRAEKEKKAPAKTPPKKSASKPDLDSEIESEEAEVAEAAEADLSPRKNKISKTKPTGKSGSRFIPAFKK